MLPALNASTEEVPSSVRVVAALSSSASSEIAALTVFELGEPANCAEDDDGSVSRRIWSVDED